MFHVVYLFEVLDGRQADFERAWKELTEAIYRNSGSLGSRLLKQDGRSYLAIAQWPNEKSWGESPAALPGWTGAIRDRMRDCCHSMETIFTGTVLADLTRNSTYRAE